MAISRQVYLFLGIQHGIQLQLETVQQAHLEPKARLGVGRAGEEQEREGEAEGSGLTGCRGF